ncbi:MAG: cytochrome d ubiquinol oxidase subunit II [Candidatus Aminicenantes bacterium]|nr:cytochrome d ubiquinol oxidase subunit II [Candidatus Aminicenantes bacterium]
MTFQITWFILWGFLWAVYFMLDGFDFGVGILYPFLARNEGEKNVARRAIGPVWDGNEVWLITAGGATFAAFPAAYASMFSYLYSALLIILFALIFRGVALEFRAKGESSAWRRSWDTAFFLGSLVPALLFGVAFGNIFRGLPIDSEGYHGTLLSLLNPYGLWTGLFFVLMFLVHGALWLALKTEGDLEGRALRFVQTGWYFLLAAAVIFLGWTAGSTGLEENYLRRPYWLIVPFLAVVSLCLIKVWAARERTAKAFFASSAMIGLVTFTGIIGLFPNLLPSRLDPAYSLTAFNASSSPYTLRIMTIVVLIFVPVVIGYQAWIYRVFRKKIGRGEAVEHGTVY